MANRSRRKKKRPTVQSEARRGGSVAHLCPIEESIRNRGDETDRDDDDGDDADKGEESRAVDFPMDDADDNNLSNMQDDGELAFLPPERLRSIRESVEGGGDGAPDPPRRVTRSMGLDEHGHHAGSEGVDDGANQEKSVDDAVVDDGGAGAGKEGGSYVTTKLEQSIHDTGMDTDVHEANKTVYPDIEKQKNLLGEVTLGDGAGGVENDNSSCSPHRSDDKIHDNADSNTERAGDGVQDAAAKLNSTPKSPANEVYTRVKTRQRGESRETIRIIFTGITPTRRHMRMIETIGAQYVDSIEEAHTATHVIAGDGVSKFRRTPKLMICLSRTSEILSIEWLEQSAREQQALDTGPFLLLDDGEAEKRYNFKMRETLRNGESARRKKGGVLGGWSIFICNGVAGNKAPSLKEMHLIVDAAGGLVMKSLTNPNTYNPKKTVVLTSDPSSKAQLRERGVSRAQGLGANVMPVMWLFRTVITQNNDLDVEEDFDSSDDEHQGSVSSTICVLSASPLVRRRRGGSQPDNAGDNSSVQSSATRGSRVSNLERAPYPPPSSSKLQRRRLEFEETSERKAPLNVDCLGMTSREQFISSNMSLLASNDSASMGEDGALLNTRRLWLEYSNKVNKANRPTKRGVRCRRGRNRSISPLVSSTTPGDVLAASGSMKRRDKSAASAAPFQSLARENPYVTWETYVLFTLASRSENLGDGNCLASGATRPISSFFPRPVSIDKPKELGGEGLALTVVASDDGKNRHEFFGTLQDVFSLHQRSGSTSGMIPEHVIATFGLNAIDAVSAMHSCGVVHNDIGLDSFLVVRANSSSSSKKTRQKKDDGENDSQWYLQMTNFGHKSIVLEYPQQRNQKINYARDLDGVANVIHRLLMGGIEISLNAAGEAVEFAAKPFISRNEYLRGALSWCSMIDTLMCVGEIAPRRGTQFTLPHPIDVLSLTSTDNEQDGHMFQFGWACRILQDLSRHGGISDYLEGLCIDNSRYIFNINRSMYTLIADYCDHQSFTCYTSREYTSDQLMHRESQLQKDATALAQREMTLQRKVTSFEKERLNHESIMKREGRIRMKEKELFDREQRLARMEEDLQLRESHLKQRPASLNQQLDPGRKSPKSILEAQPVHQNSVRKMKSTTVKHSQLPAGEMSCEETSRLPKGQDRVHQTPRSSPREGITSMLAKDKPFTTPKNVSGHKRKNNHSDDESEVSELREESQDTTSSRKRKKTRKATCPLQSLPKSPKKPSSSSSNHPPTPPKKVFIDFGDE